MAVISKKSEGNCAFKEGLKKEETGRIINPAASAAYLNKPLNRTLRVLAAFGFITWYFVFHVIPSGASAG